MPRYFFDIIDGAEHRDEIGRELESGEILRAEALRIVAALLKAEVGKAMDTALALNVRDEAGAMLLKVRMACQVEELLR